MKAKTMQRYFAGELRPDQKKSWRADDGIFVLYAEYIAVMKEKDEDIVALKAERDRLKEMLNTHFQRQIKKEESGHD